MAMYIIKIDLYEYMEYDDENKGLYLYKSIKLCLAKNFDIARHIISLLREYKFKAIEYKKEYDKKICEIGKKIETELNSNIYNNKLWTFTDSSSDEIYKELNEDRDVKRNIYNKEYKEKRESEIKELNKTFLLNDWLILLKSLVDRQYDIKFSYEEYINIPIVDSEEELKTLISKYQTLSEFDNQLVEVN